MKIEDLELEEKEYYDPEHRFALLVIVIIIADAIFVSGLVWLLQHSTIGR